MVISTVLALTALQQTSASPAIKVTRTRTLDNVKSISVAAAPTGSRIAVSSEDRVVRVMDLARGTTVWTLQGHPQPVYGLAFSPDGTLLATGDESARIWIWDLKTGKKLREFNRVDAHSRGIQNLSFSSDGKRLLSTGRDDILLQWDVATGKRGARILGSGLNFYGAKFAPTGGRIYTATLGKGAMWYAIANGKPIGNADGTHGQGVIDLDVSRDGTRLILAGRDNRGQIVDTKTGQRMGWLSGHQDWVVRAAFSPNARIAATASTDRSVRIWDVKQMRAIQTLEGQSAVGSTIAFSGDGRFLVTSNDLESLQIWSVTPPQSVPTAPTRRRK